MHESPAALDPLPGARGHASALGNLSMADQACTAPQGAHQVRHGRGPVSMLPSSPYALPRLPQPCTRCRSNRALTADQACTSYSRRPSAALPVSGSEISSLCECLQFSGSGRMACSGGRAPARVGPCRCGPSPCFPALPGCAQCRTVAKHAIAAASRAPRLAGGTANHPSPAKPAPAPAGRSRAAASRPCHSPRSVCSKLAPWHARRFESMTANGAGTRWWVGSLL